ncbi:hypothetical protein SDC9_153659 [bioreactor metagenome]|uniref:Uncharacterized protein n=1 Tax=bioreactor metagenome TaxID=1076179 RepID=A0A645F172_9ZZZZ
MGMDFGERAIQTQQLLVGADCALDRTAGLGADDARRRGIHRQCQQAERPSADDTRPEPDFLHAQRPAEFMTSAI